MSILRASGQFIFVGNMGAEQSALLVCTQTRKHEEHLELVNSELFFSLYFEKMRKPTTGPVTEALLHMVNNMPMPRAIGNGLEVNNAEEAHSSTDEDEDHLECSDDAESGFNSDSSSSTRIAPEPLPQRMAEFDSMDEYDLPVPG